MLNRYDSLGAREQTDLNSPQCFMLLTLVKFLNSGTSKNPSTTLQYNSSSHVPWVPGSAAKKQLWIQQEMKA